MMDQYNSFAEFYPFYISQHSHRTSRRLHVIGAGLALCCLASAVFFHNASLLWGMPLAGYGLGFLGHYVFEHNRPASFRHPFYSIMADFRMFFEVVSRRRVF